MDITTVLARFLGVILTVVALGFLIHRENVAGLFKEYVEGYTIPYIFALAALLFGSLIIFNHNLWTDFPKILISLFGWGMLLKGIIRMLLPAFDKKAMAWFAEKQGAVMVTLMILVLMGLYLGYVGFLA